MNPSPPERAASSAAQSPPRPFRTLHDDCETWTDTCSCEAEPRWQALEEELEAQARADAPPTPR